MFTRVEVLWGHHTKEDVPLDTRHIAEGRTIIGNALSELFGGFTMVQGFGGWVDPETKQEYREPSDVFFADTIEAVTSETIDTLKLRLAGLAFWANQTGINLVIMHLQGSTETIWGASYGDLLTQQIGSEAPQALLNNETLT